MFRQGDVLLIPLKAIPAAAIPRKGLQGRIVLAFGEVTGHAHVVREPGAELLESDTARYIRVHGEGAVLSHEEHGPIALPPGEYEVQSSGNTVPRSSERSGIRE